MTTKVTVDAHAGWPVLVTPIGSGAKPAIVEPNTAREFFVWAGQDLLIHEVQKAEAIAATEVTDEPILKFFAWEHLPAHLQPVSASFGVLACDLVARLPKCAERTVALRKLLEAKDCAVRAAVS